MTPSPSLSGRTAIVTGASSGIGRAIAEREIVPEFVPHIGGPMPIVKQATRYLQDSKNAAVQSEELHRVCLRFANHKPAEEAARLIRKVIAGTPVT